MTTAEHPDDELLVAYVARAVSEPERAALGKHLASCDNCSTRLRQFVETDRILAADVAPRAAPGLARRIAQRARARSAPSRLLTGLAAGLLFVLGGLLGARVSRTVGQTEGALVRRGAGGDPSFMVVFAEDPRSWTGVSESDLRQRSEAFRAWLSSIGEQGTMLGGAQLTRSEGRVYVPGGSEVGVAASPDALEHTGFIIVSASSYDVVAGIARRCPILDHGGQVIVRRLQ